MASWRSAGPAPGPISHGRVWTWPGGDREQGTEEESPDRSKSFPCTRLAWALISATVGEKERCGLNRGQPCLSPQLNLRPSRPLQLGPPGRAAPAASEQGAAPLGWGGGLGTAEAVPKLNARGCQEPTRARIPSHVLWPGRPIPSLSQGLPGCWSDQPAQRPHQGNGHNCQLFRLPFASTPLP